MEREGLDDAPTTSRRKASDESAGTTRHSDFNPWNIEVNEDVYITIIKIRIQTEYEVIYILKSKGYT